MYSHAWQIDSFNFADCPVDSFHCWIIRYTSKFLHEMLTVTWIELLLSMNGNTHLASPLFSKLRTKVAWVQSVGNSTGLVPDVASSHCTNSLSVYLLAVDAAIFQPFVLQAADCPEDLLSSTSRRQAPTPLQWEINTAIKIYVSSLSSQDQEARVARSLGMYFNAAGVLQQNLKSLSKPLLQFIPNTQSKQNYFEFFSHVFYLPRTQISFL